MLGIILKSCSLISLISGIARDLVIIPFNNNRYAKKKFRTLIILFTLRKKLNQMKQAEYTKLNKIKYGKKNILDVEAEIIKTVNELTKKAPQVTHFTRG